MVSLQFHLFYVFMLNLKLFFTLRMKIVKKLSVEHYSAKDVRFLFLKFVSKYNKNVNEYDWSKLLLIVIWAAEAWNCHTVLSFSASCFFTEAGEKRRREDLASLFFVVSAAVSWCCHISSSLPPSSISFNKSSHSQCLWSHPGPAHLLSGPERCLLSSCFIRLWAAPPSNKHQQRPARSPSCQFANQPTQRPAPTPVFLPQLCQLPGLIHVLFI